MQDDSDFIFSITNPSHDGEHQDDTSSTASDDELLDIDIPGKSWRDYAEGSLHYIQDNIAPHLGDAARSVVNNPVTRAMGRGFKGALASAAGRDKIRQMTYAEIDKILTKYQRSYDLSTYQKYAKQAAGKISKAVNKFPTTTNDSSQRVVDLKKLGRVGGEIAGKVGAEPGLKDNLDTVESHLGTLHPEGIEGKDGILGKYLALHDEMAEANDGYHRPEQITAAFAEIKKRAFKQVKDGKEAAIQKLQNLIPAGNPIDRNNLALEQGAFAVLLGIDINADNAHSQITTKVQGLIQHTEKSYDDTLKNLNDYFDGTPERTENDKTIPKVTGLDEQISREKERVEHDLVNRAIQLEKMEARAFKIARSSDNDLVLQSGEPEEDKEDRERALKGLTIQGLQNQSWSGYIRNRKLGNIKTRSGGTITYDMVNGKYCATSLKIPARCFFLTEESMFERMRLDTEEYISHVKAQKEPGSPIEITVNHEVDEYRGEMVLAAYKAARKNGYEPSEITLNVNGSNDEKQQFKKKPALEVLQAMGLGNDEMVKQELKAFETQKATMQTRHEKNAQRRITNAINDLKQTDDSKTQPEVEADDDKENQPPSFKQ